jgi:hypothetical protein
MHAINYRLIMKALQRNQKTLKKHAYFWLAKLLLRLGLVFEVTLTVLDELGF